MQTDLRPLSIPELLDRSISIYRRHLLTFVAIMAVPAAFGLLVMLPYTAFAHFAENGQAPEFSTNDFARWFVAGAVGFVVVFVCYGVAYVMALGATSFGVSDLYQGHSPSVGTSFARVKRHAAQLVLLMLNVGIRIWGAMAALVAVGAALSLLLSSAIGAFAVLFMFAGILAGGALLVLMVLRYSLCVPALVLEGLTASQAIKRSVELSRGNLGRAFLIGLCATMITYAASLLFQGPFFVAMVVAGPESRMGLVLNLAGTIVGTLGSTLVAPVMIIGLAVLYFDARVRTEALDVQMMMSALDRADARFSGATAPPATPL
jgi:hypothetical protein